MARRQHQHQRIADTVIDVVIAWLQAQAGACQRIGLGLEARLADQSRQRLPMQRPTLARMQEQRAAVRGPSPSFTLATALDRASLTFADGNVVTARMIVGAEAPMTRAAST